MVMSSRLYELRKETLSTESDIAHRLSRIIFWICGLIGLHTLAMMYLESMGFLDALWLSLSSITTVGYGDYSAKTELGRASTVILLYIGGIIFMAQAAGEYLDYRIARRERIRYGLWDWNMKDHILILNAPAYNSELYFNRLVQQIRKHPDYVDTPIQILTSEFKEGLPHSLTEQGVVHYDGSPTNFDDLQHVNVNESKHILVLAKREYDVSADSITFDIVYRLKDLGLVERTYVECVDDRNRDRLHDIGARVVLRPIRSYPEIVVRAMVAPGSEAILEDFFTHEGDHPQRYEVWLSNVLWAEVVSTLVKADLGTAMGYVNRDNYVIPNPPANERVTANALILLVRETNEPHPQKVLDALKPLSNQQW